MSVLITRPQWTDFRPSWVDIPKVSTVFVHHTVTSPGQEIKAACRDLEAHALSLGHRAIDYSFVVNQAGQRAEGRGWWHAGGHTLNNNSTSYGIAALGNYLDDIVTDSLIEAYAETIREGIAIGAISPNPSVRPHSDVFSTACPGRLKDAIPAIVARIATPKPSEIPDGGSTMFRITIDKRTFYTCVPGAFIRKSTLDDVNGIKTWTVVDQATYDKVAAICVPGFGLK